MELTGGSRCSSRPPRSCCDSFCDAGYEVLLETAGHRDIAPVDPRVVRIVDVKCPSSGQADRVRYENLRLLRAADEVKFVLADRADYDFARAVIAEHGLIGRCAVLMGAVAGRLDPATLAEWILADKLNVRLQIQLHKLLWPARPRGV